MVVTDSNGYTMVPGNALVERPKRGKKKKVESSCEWLINMRIAHADKPGNAAMMISKEDYIKEMELIKSNHLKDMASK